MIFHPNRTEYCLKSLFHLFICFTNTELKMNNFYSVFIWNQKQLELFIFSGTEANLFTAKPNLQQKIPV